MKVLPLQGATLELRQSDGELEVRGSKVKSVRLVDCYTYNRAGNNLSPLLRPDSPLTAVINIAGGGLPGLLAGVVLTVLLSAGLILHRRYRRYRPVAVTTAVFAFGLALMFSALG